MLALDAPLDLSARIAIKSILMLVCRSVNSLTHIGYNEAIDQQK